MRSKGTRKATRKGTRKVSKHRGGWWFWNRNRPGRGEVYFPSSNQATYNKQVAAAKRQDAIRKAYNLNKMEEKKCITRCANSCKNSYKFKNVVGARNTVGARVPGNANTRKNNRNNRNRYGNWSSFSPSV